MDKVDHSVSRIQGCRRVEWPLVGAFLASQAFLGGQFPEFFKIRKKLGHFDLKPDFNNFPEIPSSGNLTTQIAVWV